MVGQWFFQFDYWMKRASLGEEKVAVSGLPVYWDKAVVELGRETAACTRTDSSTWSKNNRYWLCAGKFTAVETDDILTFDDARLQVLAEGMGPGRAKLTTRGILPA